MELEPKVTKFPPKIPHVMGKAEYERLAYEILTGVSSKVEDAHSMGDMRKPLAVMYAIYLLRYTNEEDFFKIAETHCDLNEKELQEYVLSGESGYFMFGNPFRGICYILGKMLGTWDSKSGERIYRSQRWLDCKSPERRLQILVEAEECIEERMEIRFKIQREEHPVLNDPMEMYVRRVYEALLRSQEDSKKKMPSSKRMQRPLQILYVLKHRERYGYNSSDELIKLLCKKAGISTDGAKSKVFGSVISKLYPGLLMILEKYSAQSHDGVTLKESWRGMNFQEKYKMYLAAEARMMNCLFENHTESGDW